MGGKIAEQITDFYKKINSYFNPFGQFYIKVVIFLRVLVTEVFLDDLFSYEEDKQYELECDTSNVGCQLSCINRFSPINHLQLWQFELFCSMIATTFFMGTNLLNQHIYEKKTKKGILHKSSINFVEKRGHIHSTYTAIGYMFMLVIRLVLELYCVYIEMNLAQHHSQNAPVEGHWMQKFKLKEYWLCPTYSSNIVDGADSINQMMPKANRSDIFYRTDTIQACEQQQATVTCWISTSRMKTLGIIFMFSIMCIQSFITFMELLVELIKPLIGKNKGIGPKRQEYPSHRMPYHTGNFH